MKAMILAAGLGTRLKPWTLHHPKALVPVGGVPMLERVITSLKTQGFNEIVINVHHFGEQIIEFMAGNDFGINYEISDEREVLLDTGGALLQAGEILVISDDDPLLVHNVDILSNADLKGLMEYHNMSGNDITLLTSGRDSTRKLIFDKSGRLKGWHNLSTGEYNPKSFKGKDDDREVAFSGIYIIGKNAMDALREFSQGIGKSAFPVMDFFLSRCDELKIGERFDPELKLIDIGKPASLKQADLLFK